MAVLRNDTGILQDDEEMAPALFLPRPYLYAYFCLGLFICILCIVTICTLWKCRKLAAKIRLLSINLTVANLIYGLTLLGNFAHYKATGFICRFVPQIFTIDSSLAQTLPNCSRSGQVVVFTTTINVFHVANKTQYLLFDFDYLCDRNCF